MKKTGAAIIIAALFLYGRCEATDMFQSASSAIASFRPKPCILQPMKPMGPVSAEKVAWFQKLADSINRKCSTAPKTCNPSCRK